MGMLSNSPRKIFNDWEDSGLPAGESHIGQIGKELVICSVSMLATVSGTYTDGCYAGTGAILEFANAARVAGGKGIVRSAMFVDRGDQEAAFSLVLFNTTTVTTVLVGATTLVIDDVDVGSIVGVISCATADYTDLTDNQVAWKKDQNIYFDLPSTATTLYGIVRAAATWSPGGVSDVGIQLQIEQF